MSRQAENFALVIVIGLLIMAAAVALQPLFWRTPAPSPAEVHRAHHP